MIIKNPNYIILFVSDNNYLAIDVLNVEENLSQNRVIMKQSDEQSWTHQSYSLSNLPQLFQIRLRAETLPFVTTQYGKWER